MGRLIDADALIELLQRKRKTLLGIGGNTYSIKAFDYIIARIEEQPTVCKCEKCNLFYKSSLGHECKEVQNVTDR